MNVPADFNSRPASRSPIPEPRELLRQLNRLLAENDLSPCDQLNFLQTDQDTANPTAIAISAAAKYVVKVATRPGPGPETQGRFANAIGRVCGLPVPRHVCWQSAPGRMLLLVMDYIPGAQLAQALRQWTSEALPELCADWGRCHGLFHAADVTKVANIELQPDTPERRRQTAARHRDASAKALAALRQSPQAPAFDVEAAERFLLARAASLHEWALPGLTKADEDLRDFLAAPTPTPHIAALLDFERPAIGDTIHRLAIVHLRLHLLGGRALWPHYRRGYESARGIVLQRCEQFDYYLLSRALAAASHSPIAARIITELLENRLEPF